MDTEYTIARYQRANKRFEILVDPDKALEFKLGRRKDFNDILLYEEVYTDAKKGLRAARSDIQAVFGTLDIYKVAEKILREGDLLIKTEQRKRLIEEKRRQIISYISKYCVDARTSAPIPPTRVETAIEEAGVKIDPFKSTDEQVKYVITEISKVIPIKQQISILSIKIPSIYIGKAYGFIKNSAEIISESWLSNGSYSAQVAIPSGLKQEFMNKLGSITAGAAYVEVVGEKTI